MQNLFTLTQIEWKRRFIKNQIVETAQKQRQSLTLILDIKKTQEDQDSWQEEAEEFNIILNKPKINVILPVFPINTILPVFPININIFRNQISEQPTQYIPSRRVSLFVGNQEFVCNKI